MKYTKIILPALAATMALTGCDDQIMEWREKGDVTVAEIPLEVKEVLANYDDIKVYAAQYMPTNIIGIGMGADLYTANANGEATLVNANYQMFTPGNAMKMDAMLTNSGAFKFTTVDALIDAMPSDMKLYGHNFFWHTQQNQSYLKSLIDAEMVINSSGDDDCENVITNSDFEDGTQTGWTGWSKYTRSVVSPGHDSNYALKCEMNSETTSNWDCQLWWPLAQNLVEGTTYVYSFYLRSDDNIQVQFIGQNSSYSGIYKDTFTGKSEWTLCKGEFTYTGSPEDICRIGLQFGGTPNSVIYVDDFKFGKKIEDPMENVITNSNFDDGTDDGWQGWSKYSRSVEEGGHSGKYALKCVMNSETTSNWDCQLWWPLAQNLVAGTIYSYSFYIKSPDKVVAQFIGQNADYSGLYKDSFTAPDEWFKCEGQFLYEGSPADICRIGLQFGGTPNTTLWIDDFKFGAAKDQSSSAKRSVTNGMSRATTITFKPKSAAEKKAALVGAMETWVKGMADHLKEKGVTLYGYDVINEPIADGSNGVRGLNGVFGGSVTDDDGNVTYDSAPTEDETSGLTLNWGSGHWYWGYYVPDYAVRAFQLARQYLPAETKLFVNDYNLETSPSKLAALIDFVKQIDTDNGSAIVDGIGTQMHITLSGTSDDADNNATKIAACKAQVDAMFKTLAATGKLVRVTELDISLGTSSPSSAQYKAQADCYEMIVKSYKENIPTAQQSGITIWSLSDNEAEHKYWLNGQLPNLFDSDYLRKWAYKGFCDGIAGEDLGLKFGGDDYKAYYEKNNVSSSFK